MRVSESKLASVVAASVISCALTLLTGILRGQDRSDSADIPAPGNHSGVVPLQSEGNYLRFSHQAGRGLGFRDASTAVGGFLPFAQREMSLGFLDAQLLVTNHGRLGMNAGLGYRWLNVDESRLWDASLWFDLENTERRTLDQLGASVSTIGAFESRINFYAPLDRDAQTDAVLTDTSFQGNEVLIERTIWRTTPMLGVEGEIGGAVPGLDNALFGYLGAYSFDADEGVSANGFMARVEIEPVPSLLAFARLRSDSVFGTTVMLGGSIFFPHPRVLVVAPSCALGCSTRCAGTTASLVTPVWNRNIGQRSMPRRDSRIESLMSIVSRKILRSALLSSRSLHWKMRLIATPT